MKSRFLTTRTGLLIIAMLSVLVVNGVKVEAATERTSRRDRPAARITVVRTRAVGVTAKRSLPALWFSGWERLCVTGWGPVGGLGASPSTAVKDVLTQIAQPEGGLIRTAVRL